MKWRHRTAKFLAGIGGGALPPLLPLIFDDFLTDLPAGSVDGTPADPGPGTRSTGITGVISGGNYVMNGAADDSLWYDEVIAGVAGQTATFTFTILDVTPEIYFGFDDDKLPGLRTHGFRVFADRFEVTDGSSIGPYVLGAADSVEYVASIVLRSAGASYFIDGNLLAIFGADATSALYAGLSNTNIVGTFSSIKVPKTLWAPTPTAADTGTSADVAGTYYTDGGTLTGIEAGGDGVEWAGPTWANGVSGASNTPTLGTDLVTNGDMESGDPPTGWTYSNGSIAANVDAYTGSQSLDLIAPGTVTFTLGISPSFSRDPGWYQATIALKNIDSSRGVAFRLLVAAGINQTSGYYTGTTWLNRILTFRQRTTINSSLEIMLYANNESCHILADDFICKSIPTVDLFRSISDLASPYAYISASWTTETQAGIVTCLDSASDPQNFIIVYRDGTSVVTEKCVAGTYTILATVAVTYSADAPLILRTLPNDAAGVDWWCIYNGAYIANGTVTDAGIVDNTLHGLFSTSSDNVCSNVEIFPANGHQPPGA